MPLKSPLYYTQALSFLSLLQPCNNFWLAYLSLDNSSQNNQLKFQAGAGVVSQSVPESELQEVFNKIGALEHAIKEAEKL